MKVKDYYKILGVARTSTSVEIKNAYRQLAKVYHPDLNQGSESIARKFADITEAYNILGNLDKRLQYSMLLSRSKTLLDKVSLVDYGIRNR
jgi:DnaJ-class molecular chaperone